jgi:hypothetical protein
MLALGKNGTIYVFDTYEVHVMASFNYKEKIECMTYYNGLTYYGTSKGTLAAMDFESSCDIVVELVAGIYPLKVLAG